MVCTDPPPAQGSARWWWRAKSSSALLNGTGEAASPCRNPSIPLWRDDGGRGSSQEMTIDYAAVYVNGVTSSDTHDPKVPMALPRRMSPSRCRASSRTRWQGRYAGQRNVEGFTDVKVRPAGAERAYDLFVEAPGGGSFGCQSGETVCPTRQRPAR